MREVFEADRVDFLYSFSSSSKFTASNPQAVPPQSTFEAFFSDLSRSVVTALLSNLNLHVVLLLELELEPNIIFIRRRFRPEKSSTPTQYSSFSFRASLLADSRTIAVLQLHASFTPSTSLQSSCFLASALTLCRTSTND